MITLGVEVTFVLLDPSTGATVLAAPDLVRMLGGEPGIQQELMRFQVETGTPVCTSLDGLGRELIRLRRLAAAAAARLGCLLPAGGAALIRTPGLAAVTGQPRYRELGLLVRPGGGRGLAPAGCHVHVGVPLPGPGRPGAGAAAALAGGAARRHRQLPDRLWLRYRVGQLAGCDPVPLADRDPAGGVAGRGRLRRGGPPPHRARGSAGRASVSSLARLSPRYPTVEVRVADVCLDVGTAVLAAGLTRALVATALAEARRGTPVAAPPAGQVAAALAAAARRGARRGRSRPGHRAARHAAALRARLLEHVYPALSDCGDTEIITGLLRLAR